MPELDLTTDLAETVTRLTRVGSCRSPQFSPDGQTIAFRSNLTGRPQVWTVPVESGWPTLVTAFDDPVTGLSWSPDGAWLACLVAPGGGMNSQVYLVRPDGSEVRLITDGGKETNTLGVWSHNGKHLAIASNRRDPNAMDVYLFDAVSWDLRLFGRNNGIGRITDLSRDGRFAILYRMASRGDDNLYLIDLPSGQEQLLTPHDGPGSFQHGAFSEDGQTVYLITNKDSDLCAFGRVLIGTDGVPGPIDVLAAREDAELEEFTISEDGAIAALLWNVAGRSQLDLYDLPGVGTTRRVALPSALAEDVTFSSDGRTLALTCLGSTAPDDIWTIDTDTLMSRQVTQSPHPGVDLTRLTEPTLVCFPAHDGLGLSAWLSVPANTDGPYPVVMDFHGGPEGQSRPGFSSDHQALLQQGIAVFVPNVRGSSGFGKRFVNLDNGTLRHDAIRDIEACLTYVTDTGIADPNRIGIMGGSYGGYMTMAGLTRYPDRFAAGANMYGVVNFETFFAQTEPWMAAISTIEYGDPVTERDLLRDLSPIHQLDLVTAPTLVIHGANDTNVPVVEAEQVVDGLKARGVPVDYILFLDEGHGFLNEANRIRADVAVVGWFVAHLMDRGVLSKP